MRAVGLEGRYVLVTRRLLLYDVGLNDKYLFHY